MIRGDTENAGRLAGATFPPGWPERVEAREGLSWHLRHLVGDAAQHAWRIRVIVERDSGIVVGSINLKGPPDAHGDVEVGWGVNDDRQRRGYALEATTAVLTWAAAQPGVRRFSATIPVANVPSQELAKKLGMTRTAEIRRNLPVWQLMPTMSRDRGYAIASDLFTRAEMVEAIGALDRAGLNRSKAGARHVLSVPAVFQLASDPRMMDLARRFVGATPVPFRGTFFDKSAASNWLVGWHQDTALPLRNHVSHPDWGPWSTKGGVLHARAPAHALERVIALRVHLDDATALNGPLRVLPDSHLRGILADHEIQRLARETQAVECVAAAGSAVAMRPLIVHASSKGSDGSPRRVLHIEYAATLDLGGGIELMAVLAT